MLKNYWILYHLKYNLIIYFLILLSISLPIIHSNIFRYIFEDPKFALYDICSSIITIYYFYNKKEIHFSLFSILNFILLFLMVISIIQSVNIGSSIETLFRFFNTVILTAFIYELLNSNKINLKQLNNIVFISAFIFSIYYLYGTQLSNIFVSRNSFSPIGHINYTSHLLDIWIPLLLLNFFIQKNNVIKYLSLIIMLFLVNLLVVSMIRGSIISIIISEITVILFLFFKFRKIVLYPIITISIIIIFWLNQIFFPTTIEKYVDINTALPSNITEINIEKINSISANRLNIYKNTIDMIIDNPLGVGIGNFEYIHPKYAKVSTPYATNYVNEFEVFSNPHNIILNFTSELGWIGGGIFIVIIIFFIRMVFYNIYYGNKIDYIVAIALGTNFLHSMLSAIFLTPANMFFMTFLFAILLYRYFNRVEKKILFIFKKVYLKFLFIGILLFFLIFHISKYYCNQFTVQRDFKYIEYAILFNPFNEYALLKRARYEAYVNRNWTLAIFYLDKLLILYPYHISGLIKKATFEYRAKQYNNALITIDKLLLIDYKNKKMLTLRDRINQVL